MRLWTIHPRYLDRQGLTAVWRESLLAQAVLLGKTRGYTRHPQLIRFRNLHSPIAGIATYLEHLHRESIARGYNFNHSLIQKNRMRKQIVETRGQLQFEWSHLLSKLQKRSPEIFANIQTIQDPQPHPLFEMVPGKIKDWEKGQQINLP